MSELDKAELRTERLVLKVLDPSFAARVLDYIVRNWEFHKEWLPRLDETFFTLEFQESRLQHDLDLLKDDRMVRLWIFKKEDRDFRTVIGDLAFSNIIRGSFQSCHLGYKMAESEINKGYVAEALRRAIPFAFEELKLHRIEANIMPKNKRSIQVVEKLGFVNEGIARKYLKINGVWEDHIHYVMLNPNEG